MSDMIIYVMKVFEIPQQKSGSVEFNAKQKSQGNLNHLSFKK